MLLQESTPKRLRSPPERYTMYKGPRERPRTAFGAARGRVRPKTAPSHHFVRSVRYGQAHVTAQMTPSVVSYASHANQQSRSSTRRDVRRSALTLRCSSPLLSLHSLKLISHLPTSSNNPPTPSSQCIHSLPPLLQRRPGLAAPFAPLALFPSHSRSVRSQTNRPLDPQVDP